MKALPGVIGEKDFKEKLIEEELKKGYVPMRVTFKRVKHSPINSLKEVVFDMVSCYSGYLGKKQARIFYNANRGLLNKIVDRINII